MEWINANTIVGSPATGNNYFHRETVHRKLWREVEKGNHVLFTAPRRIGKSSVMKHLAKNHATNYLCNYKNIASDDTSKDFYKRLFNLALLAVNAKTHAIKKLQNWIRTIGIEKIGADGITIKGNDIDYKASLLALMPQLKNVDLKVALFLDEFPDVIRNIHKNEGKKAAKNILQTLRSIRDNDDSKGQLTLILAGSIGLDHVVKEIDRTTVINDLNFQYLPVLSSDEARNFLIIWYKVQP